MQRVAGTKWVKMTGRQLLPSSAPIRAIRSASPALELADLVRVLV